MKMYCVARECELLAEKAEEERLVRPWVDRLVAKARAYDGVGFAGQVRLLVGWGLRDPERRPVVAKVVRIVGQQVPELKLTLESILAGRMSPIILRGR